MVPVGQEGGRSKTCHVQRWHAMGGDAAFWTAVLKISGENQVSQGLAGMHADRLASAQLESGQNSGNKATTSLQWVACWFGAGGAWVFARWLTQG